MTPPRCPYCESSASLVSRPSGPDRSVWECQTAGCDSFVGVRESEPMPWPNGTMADSATHRLRSKLRAVYSERINRIPRNKCSMERNHLVNERKRVNWMDYQRCQEVLMKLLEERSGQKNLEVA